MRPSTSLATSRPRRSKIPSRTWLLLEIAYSIVHETPVPITRVASSVPCGLDEFFDRALAKDPASRFGDAASFREELSRALRSREAAPGEATRIDARPSSSAVGAGRPDPAGPGPRWTGRWGVAVVAVVAVLASATLLVSGWRNGVDLRLDARTSFRDASLQLLVDGEQVYERELDAPDSPSGTLGKLKRLIDTPEETFEAWIRVDPGKHEIVALIHPDGGGNPYRDSIAVELRPGERRRLKLVAGPKKMGATVSLKLGDREKP